MRVPRLAVLAFCVVVVAGCLQRESSLGSALTGDPAEPDCGFTLGTPGNDTTPPQDPCDLATASLLVPATTLDPAPGDPALDQASFSVAEPGFACVDLAVDRIASASATFNGSEILGVGDFSADVEHVTRVVPVVPPDADLAVMARATPGGSLTYEVLFTPMDTEPRGVVDGAAGRLSIFNLHDGLDPFSPADGNGVRDSLALSVTAEVSSAGISVTSSTRHFLRYAFEIASSLTCGEVRRLDGEVEITSATPTTASGNFRVVLFAVWDGRASGGELVDDGVYFYRAAVDLVRVAPSGSQPVRDSAVSEILTTTVDNTPPEVTITVPVDGHQMFRLEAASLAIDAEGTVRDESGLVATTFSVNGDAQPTTVDGTGVAIATLPLEIEGPDLRAENVVLLVATDTAGNTASATARLDVIADWVPDELLLFTAEGATDADADAVAVLLGAVVVERDPAIGAHLLELPDGLSPNAAADMLLDPSFVPTDLQAAIDDVGINNVYVDPSPTLPPETGVGGVFDTLGVAAGVPIRPGLGFVPTGSLPLYMFVNADLAWDLEQGDPASPVLIAELDAGVDAAHLDLGPNVCAACGADVTGKVPTQFPGLDPSGHGTWMSGIVGSVANGFGIPGLVWNVTIVPVVTDDANGIATDWTTARGVNFATDALVDIIHVASYGDSLRERRATRALSRAIDRAGRAGVLVVAAAGNVLFNGPTGGSPGDIDARADLIEVPCELPASNMICVGAFDFPTTGFAVAANTGPLSVDLGAPGLGIGPMPMNATTSEGRRVSTVPICPSAETFLLGTTCTWAYGQQVVPSTSPAQAWVSGTAALVKSFRPDLGPEGIIDAIMDGSQPFPAGSGIAGVFARDTILDARGALDAASTAFEPELVGELAESFFKNSIGFEKDVRDGALSPDGNELGLGSDDNSVVIVSIVGIEGRRLTDVDRAAVDPALLLDDSYPGNVRAVAYSPDGSLFAYGGLDTFYRLVAFDPDPALRFSGRVSVDVPVSGTVHDLAFGTLSDGTTLLAIGTSMGLELHQITFGPVATLVEDIEVSGMATVNAVAISPDGERVAAVVGSDKLLAVYPIPGLDFDPTTVADQVPIFIDSDTDQPGNAVAFSDSYLAFGRDRGSGPTLLVYTRAQIDNDVLVPVSARDTDRHVRALGFAPDESYLAVGHDARGSGTGTSHAEGWVIRAPNFLSGPRFNTGFFFRNNLNAAAMGISTTGGTLVAFAADDKDGPTLSSVAVYRMRP